MYLSMLSNEKKHLFLNLEIYMFRENNVFSDEEKQIIDAYCMEMHIDNNNYEADMPKDDVFSQLKDTLTLQEKKIVFLEFVGSVMADDKFIAEEKTLVDKLAVLFELTEDEVQVAFSIISDLKTTYERCADYIQ